MDVIEFKPLEGCALPQYPEVVKDFNKWGKKYGYNTEIAVPLQNNNLTSMFWMGSSADAAAFGKAWDAWRDAQGDSNSTPAKLQARFDACSENIARRSYDVY